MSEINDRWKERKALFNYDDHTYTISATLRSITKNEIGSMVDHLIPETNATECMRKVKQENCYIQFNHKNEFITPEEFRETSIGKRVAKALPKDYNVDFWERGESFLGYCMEQLEDFRDFSEIKNLECLNSVLFCFRFTTNQENTRRFDLVFEETYVFINKS